MKFINYLAGIAGIGVYPLLSLVIFVGFFAGLSIYLLRARKEHMEELSNLPLK